MIPKLPSQLRSSLTLMGCGSSGGGASAPAVPTGFAAVPGAFEIAELSWDLVSGTTTNIYVDGVLYDNVPDGTNTYSFTGTPPGAIYDFQISAVSPGSGLESTLTAVISCAIGDVFTGALDGFPPDYAWSHRRALVSSFTGNILQARRTSDDTPYDVAVSPSNGEGDIAGLQSFVGGNTAAVASLTEQMGTGDDFLQTTGSLQRIIVDSGSLVTVGGKAASRGTRTGTNNVVGGGMVAATTYTGSTLSVFIRGMTDALTGVFLAINAPLFVAGKNDTQSGPGQFITLFGPTDASGVSVIGNDAYMVNAQPYATDYLISIICDGSTLTFKDGTYTYTYALTRAFDINKFLIGCLTESYQDNGAAAVKIQELAIWTSDQTANEAAIRSALLA